MQVDQLIRGRIDDPATRLYRQIGGVTWSLRGTRDEFSVGRNDRKRGENGYPDAPTPQPPRRQSTCANRTAELALPASRRNPPRAAVFFPAAMKQNRNLLSRILHFDCPIETAYC